MGTITIDELFRIAVEKGASDLHLVTDMQPVLRIDGELKPIDGTAVLSATDVEKLCYSILTEQQKATYIEDRELDISHEIDNLSRFRVNLHWEKEHAGMVARVIAMKIPTMEEINMPAIVYDLIKLNQGLILVTGPTGSGKSTSLAAMIDLINRERARHIITLEDPIEFVYEPKKSIIKQRQYGTDILSFAQGLKHVLRQDPNVILVGEMRDLETIASTITLAETGHLVMATLHTLNAAQTIDRIIDVFPPYQQPQVRLQLSLFLRAVISQQLLPKKGGGRIASREILLNTPAVANLIRENKIAQIKTAIQTSKDHGMITMDQAVKQLYEQDMIEESTAQAHISDPTILR